VFILQSALYGDIYKAKFFVLIENSSVDSFLYIKS